MKRFVQRFEALGYLKGMSKDQKINTGIFLSETSYLVFKLRYKLVDQQFENLGALPPEEYTMKIANQLLRYDVDITPDEYLSALTKFFPTPVEEEEGTETQEMVIYKLMDIVGHLKELFGEKDA